MKIRITFEYDNEDNDITLEEERADWLAGNVAITDFNFDGEGNGKLTVEQVEG